MGITKIWAIKDSLSRVVGYAENAEKTEFSDMQQVLHYAQNGEKVTSGPEKTMYVTTLHCRRDHAYEDTATCWGLSPSAGRRANRSLQRCGWSCSGWKQSPPRPVCWAVRGWKRRNRWPSSLPEHRNRLRPWSSSAAVSTINSGGVVTRRNRRPSRPSGTAAPNSFPSFARTRKTLRLSWSRLRRDAGMWSASWHCGRDLNQWKRQNDDNYRDNAKEGSPTGLPSFCHYFRR